MEPDEEFTLLYERVTPAAFAVAWRILGDRTAAEDTVAEALARTLARWPRVRRLDAPVSWVLKVTTNAAIDELRRRSREQPADRIHADRSVDGPEPDAVAIRDLLRELSARQREVVALRYLAGYDQDDVARILGITTGSVKQHAHRGLRRLRELLDDADTRSTAGYLEARNVELARP